LFVRLSRVVERSGTKRVRELRVTVVGAGREQLTKDPQPGTTR
jgi:hypothetical protein